MAVDKVGQIIMTAGIDYKGDYKHVTQTGSADSDCYIGAGTSYLGFDRKVVFDSPAMCLDVNILGTGNSAITRPDGLPDAVVSAMAGQQPMLLSLSYKNWVSGGLMIKDPVKLPFGHFPTVVTTDNYFGGVYIALHNTNGEGIAPASDDDPVDEFKNAFRFLLSMTRPEWLPGIGTYSPRIFKYDIIENKPKWQTTFMTTNGRSSIGGMVVVLSRNKLVVAGSSTGLGPTVGANAQSAGDWDGYLTVLDTETGDIDTRNTTTEINAPHSIRISSQPEKDDFVFNVCASDDKVYVVGSTKGKIKGDVEGGGFIAKFDIDTLDIIWKHQFDGMGVEANLCDVVGDFVYVGGHVPAGIVFDNPNSNSNSNSNGKASVTTDIFIALFSAETGTLKWIRQIDSLREDKLVKIIINLGNTLLFTANAMGPEKGKNDLYTMSIDPAGVHDWQNLKPGVDPISGASDDT